jgi:hypothetical protein
MLLYRTTIDDNKNSINVNFLGFSVIFSSHGYSAHRASVSAAASSRAVRRAVRGRGPCCHVLGDSHSRRSRRSPTVTVVVTVSVLVTVLMVVLTSVLIGGGGTNRRPVSGVPVAPAGPALVVLPLLLRRVQAAGGVLRAVRVGGAAPRSLSSLILGLILSRMNFFATYSMVPISASSIFNFVSNNFYSRICTFANFEHTNAQKKALKQEKSIFYKHDDNKTILPFPVK